MSDSRAERAGVLVEDAPVGTALLLLTERVDLIGVKQVRVSGIVLDIRPNPWFDRRVWLAAPLAAPLMAGASVDLLRSKGAPPVDQPTEQIYEGSVPALPEAPYAFACAFRVPILSNDEFAIDAGFTSVRLTRRGGALEVPPHAPRLVASESIEQTRKPPDRVPNLPVVDLPDDEGYLIAIAGGPGSDPDVLRKLEDRANFFPTIVAITAGPEILADPVYRGPIVASPDEWVSYTMVRAAARRALDLEALRAAHDAVFRLFAEDRARFMRFVLQSRFYVRACGFTLGEDKFLGFWTVLEIWPLKGSTKIRDLREWVGQVAGWPPGDVDRLELGRLYGRRGRVVHDGMHPDPTTIGWDCVLLERIATEALRSLIGLPYGGWLERYRLPPDSPAPAGEGEGQK